MTIMNDKESEPQFMEALEWFARMRDEKASESERNQFDCWLSASPDNAAAYERAKQLWDRFEIVKPEYERLQRRETVGRRSVLLGAVSLFIIGSGGYMATRTSFFADHSTAPGERQTFTLPDGSTAEIGSHSAFSIRYTTKERRIALLRGQAFLSVAADATRPFIVEAGGGTVRALGTRFDVNLLDNDVIVTVVEHSVLISTTNRTPVILKEGWQVTYDGSGIASPHQIDISTVQAWRDDRIVFEDVPLRRVLKELERYRRGRIVLVDDTIGDIPVTTVFETRRAAEALRIIAETLPIRVADAGLVAFVYRR